MPLPVGKRRVDADRQRKRLEKEYRKFLEETDADEAFNAEKRRELGGEGLGLACGRREALQQLLGHAREGAHLEALEQRRCLSSERPVVVGRAKVAHLGVEILRDEHVGRLRSSRA